MIRENFERYTKKQVQGAIKACHLQVMLGHPSRKDHDSMVHANLINNCPVTPEISFMLMPINVIQTNKNATLTADVMFVNNLPFVITCRRGIGFIMVEFTPN